MNVTMENKTELSRERKKKYKAGAVLIFLGGLLFLSYFLDIIFFILNVDDARSAFDETRNMWLRALLGMILMALGRMKQSRALTGLMKPNTNMDLEQYIEERKHLRKLKGKQLNDTLSEINLAKYLGTPVIKIKCQNCSHLNDEEDKFCGDCGQKI